MQTQLYVLTKSSKLHLNEKQVIGIFSQSHGLEKKLMLDQINSEFIHQLEGPFNVDIVEKVSDIPTDLLLNLPSVPNTPLRLPHTGPVGIKSIGDSLRLLND